MRGKSPRTARNTLPLTISHILMNYFFVRGGDIEQKATRAKAPRGDFGDDDSQGVSLASKAALLGIESESDILILGSGIWLMRRKALLRARGSRPFPSS